MHRSTNTKCAAVLITLFAAAARVEAQATFGTITGVIADSSGGVVPQTTIAVINQATNVERRVTSDARGNYEATHLNPGSYTVRVEATGFKRFENRDVLLQSQQTARVDVQLEVGSVGSEVTVTTGAPVVETDAPTISDVKSALQIRDLPLNTL